MGMHWAFYQVPMSIVFTPRIVTDCLGIVETLSAGLQKAVAYNAPIFRVWKMNGNRTDSEHELLRALELISWFPSHTTSRSLGFSRGSCCAKKRWLV